MNKSFTATGRPAHCRSQDHPERTFPYGNAKARSKMLRALDRGGRFREGWSLQLAFLGGLLHFLVGIDGHFHAAVLGLSFHGLIVGNGLGLAVAGVRDA